MLKRAKFPAIGLIKISLISICIFLLTISCTDNLIDPYSFDTNFKGYITCSMGNAVIRSDYSVWNINLELIGDRLVLNPVAVRNKNFQHAVAYEMLEGINLLAQQDGNVWYWGHWLPSSCTYTGSAIPILLTKLANIQSMILTTNEVYFLIMDGSVWKVKLEQCKAQTYKTPKQLTELKNIVKITTALALDSSGKVYPINETESDYGGYIPGLNDVVDIETSFHRSYIVKRDGSVWGWGRNLYLDLGSDDPNFIRQSPVQIACLSEIVKVSSNYACNLALKKDGTVWYWGYAGRDQNNKPIYSPPHKIDGLENVVLMKAGATCLFMKSDGSVWYCGQLEKKLVSIVFPEG
jgi:alpha-tubulin suppressor-like RCC1 family protein